MTYSIVARDPVTGELGVAVQSGTFGVGTVVPWARPGVGAVATQAIAEPAYGPRCLDALAAGSSATEALEAAAAADAAAFLRQVGVVAADGTVAAVTGGGCIDHAGHLLGDGFAVQANMMASPRVWPAMADAFTAAAGPLPGRLLAALEAAQRAGGDARGMRSAALLVVGGQPADPWAGRLVDLSEPELTSASHVAFDQLTDLVAAAQAEGWQPGFEPRRLAAALWSAVHGLVSLWVPGALQRPTGATDLAEILDPLLAIVVHPEGGSQ